MDLSKRSVTEILSVILPGLFNSHSHLRDEGVEDYGLLAHAAVIQQAHFEWSVGMPNTFKPILTGDDSMYYLDRIHSHAPNLNVVAVCYLTLETTPQMIREAFKLGVRAYKVYIDGATHNSKKGVPIHMFDALDPAFYVIAELDGIVELHGEDPRVNPSHKRESAILPLFRRMVEKHPNLKIVFEHISSAAAIKVCRDYPNVWMGVTPHHLYLTEKDAAGFADYLCMPVIKSPKDRAALRKLFASGHPRVIAGLDDAPHTIQRKHPSKPDEKIPPGIWCVEAALSIYAKELAQQSALHLMPDVLWWNGAKLYNLPAPTRSVRVVKKPMTIRVEEDPSKPQPFLAGQTLEYSVERLPAT